MIDKLMLGGYIGFMVGIAANSVGQLTDPPHPIPWWLPLMMFAVVSIPAVLSDRQRETMTSSAKTLRARMYRRSATLARDHANEHTVFSSKDWQVMWALIFEAFKVGYRTASRRTK